MHSVVIIISCIARSHAQMWPLFTDVVCSKLGKILPQSISHRKCCQQSASCRLFVTLSIYLCIYCDEPLGTQPSQRVCKPAYFVPVPSQDKLGGLCEGYLA